MCIRDRRRVHGDINIDSMSFLLDPISPGLESFLNELKTEMAETLNAKITHYNFDFDAYRPIKSEDNTKNRFEWELHKPEETISKIVQEDAQLPLTNLQKNVTSRFSVKPLKHKRKLLSLIFNEVSFCDKEDKTSYVQTKKKKICLLYTSPSPRDLSTSRMPSSA
eukprot:TRINITY_DN16925_c0_g1_i1.p1 TRINITY_DN16925_c0_g1~~TRINITY_DN16925_c0_g1_i1.p1  ORF type:complete len:175 (-),score=61.69 TRINITY_DN16925_c0_g1_i1:9-503(-)